MTRLLPVLPLRDIVVFPKRIVPLFVGREKSVAALEVAMAADKELFLVAQLDPGEDDPDRDIIEKRAEYARAGISEYWIVDPERRLVAVNRLGAGRYVLHGEFTPGEKATSELLAGFMVDVTALFGVIDELPK